MSVETAENPFAKDVAQPLPDPTSLVIFGAGGDLAARKLIPAVYNLSLAGLLPDPMRVVGVARRHDVHSFRKTAREAIKAHSRTGFDEDAWRALEPRLGIELTRPSPTGGYFKLRAGIHRETAGRLGYEGTDLALRQAFAQPPDAFRAGAGASLLGEFYENGFRFDVDISQVVVERLTSVRAAGRRRISFGFTVRM